MAQTAHLQDLIAPATLMDQVRSTAPFLFQDDDAGPAPAMEWLTLLRKADLSELGPTPSADRRIAYFALCLASHHATVATFVPTDVDSKIRGHCWKDRDPAVLLGQLDLARRAHAWNAVPVSTRVDADERGPISGHDGEWLAVAVGAVGGLLRAGLQREADDVAASVTDELAREAAAFIAEAERVRRGSGDELRLLRLAWILTHNVGDVDQGLSYWAAGIDHPLRARCQRLAHDGGDRHGGAFRIAAALYRTVLAAEGHRNYPLRAVKALRRSPDLLLPLGPCLDDWGARIGTHGRLSDDERAEILTALLGGCRKVPNQVGYYRAIAGMAAAVGMDRLGKRLATAARKGLDDPQVKRHLAVRPDSFASSLRKQARAALVGA